MKTNTPLTIWNKYYDTANKVEVYSRAVIPAVMWENRSAVSILQSGGNLEANFARIFIPFAGNKLTYYEPKAFKALPALSKASAWTLNADDIVAKGEVTTDIEGLFTLSDLIAQEEKLYYIKTIDTMDMGAYALRHWMIEVK